MQNYSLIQQYLHDLVLKNPSINKALFEIEKLFYSKKKNIMKRKHLFITGLPRCGTTSLLNYFYSSGEFASLKFSNMPFILSPNISKFFNLKNIKRKERIHSDGIDYDINSPEALDEVFFNNDENFIKLELLNYLGLILKSNEKERYISKNNLHYKRIELIISLLPNSIFIIPIREPLQHSYSLMRQNNRFVKLQNSDDFIRRYMVYLNHNEFGLNHKPWCKSKMFVDLKDINYWLEQWLLFYKDISEKYKSHPSCMFVKYENLSDSNYLNKLTKKIKINFSRNMKLDYFKNSKRKIILPANKNLYKKTIKLYKKISSYFPK